MQSVMNKKTLKRWAAGPAIGMLLIGMSMTVTSGDYMTHRKWDAEVVGKYISHSKHGRENYNMIYRLRDGQGLISDGHRFDRPSSGGTYHTSGVGQVNTVYLRPFDIKQTGRQNALFFFLPCILMSIGITSILSPLLSAFFRLADPDPEPEAQ